MGKDSIFLAMMSKNNKWTYEICRELSLRFNSKAEFHKTYDAAYRVARKNKWLKDFFWLKDGRIIENAKHTIWTYDTCKEVALRCSTLKEFYKRYGHAYLVAKKNGWIDEYTWLSRTKKIWRLSYEDCFNEAKKYETKADFIRGSLSAYHCALKKGWLKDYIWFIDGINRMAKNNTIWTYNTCYELARGCKSSKEVQQKSRSAYNVMLRNGWIEDYDWFTPKARSLTYEECRALAKPCKTRSEFYKAHANAYALSVKNGWLDTFEWISRPFNVYSERCDNVYAYFFEAYKSVYVGRTVNPQERDISHRNSEASAVYRFAQKQHVEVPKMTILATNLMLIEGLEKEDEYRQKYEDEGWNVLNKAKTGKKSGSLGGLNLKKWNRQKCLEEAQKYKTLKDFIHGSGGAYAKARKQGWLEDYNFLYTPHHKPRYWNHERCYEEAKKYSSRGEFALGSGSAYNAAKRNGWLNEYSWFVSRVSRLCKQEDDIPTPT